jgi:sec-independent protein translocase protein TatC
MSTAAPPTQPTSPITPDDDPTAMTWIDHLKELRDRLLKASLAVLLGLGVGLFLVYYNDFALIKYVLQYLTPLVPVVTDNSGSAIQVQTFRPTEFFTTTMKIGLSIGVALAMPVIMYQLLAYVVPGLTQRERRIIYFVLPFIIGLFVMGLTFGWLITVPTAFRFLLLLGSDVVDVRPTFEEVLSLFVRLMLISGVLFELPLVIYSLIWLGVVERRTLAKYRRYAILVIVVLAAIITPTGDPLSLALHAVPMYVLYELGLLLALLAPSKKTVVVRPSSSND